MNKYNEQCLSSLEADIIAKPDQVNQMITIGRIVDLSTAVEVIFINNSAPIPEKRYNAISDGNGDVLIQVQASMILWLRNNDTYTVLINKQGGNLYNFKTWENGEEGNAAIVRLSSECTTDAITLNLRKAASCTTC